MKERRRVQNMEKFIGVIRESSRGLLPPAPRCRLGCRVSPLLALLLKDFGQLRLHHLSAGEGGSGKEEERALVSRICQGGLRADKKTSARLFRAVATAATAVKRRAARELRRTARG